MKSAATILTFVFLSSIRIYGQESNQNLADFRFKGQLSTYGHFNPDNKFPFWAGARYIPQANLEFNLGENRMIDLEVSANGYGNMGVHPFDSIETNGDLKPYRIWIRYSTKQLELRAGLQKINFGSATMLRPLMWFDQLDPRDPLQLTDGVWGVLARYYFLNNANIWAWALYGNKNPKGWETVGTQNKKPEFGGRIQLPVPKGEAALSYHYRNALHLYVNGDKMYITSPENRVGFDAKFDLAVGCWIEASWVSNKKNVGLFTNQEILNLGMDYTFGIGNGLTVIFEQLVASFDEKPFAFDQTMTFSLLNVSYPVGLFDRLSAIVYYDWINHSAYNFINWQKQFNNLSLFVMGYMNPKNYDIPTQTAGEMLFAGTGVQVMVVLNH